jgi:predicted NBD/HSP70 family sugar kinase
LSDDGFRRCIDGLPDQPGATGLAGLGIATPFQLWDWTEQAGAPRDEMDLWRGCDLRAELDKFQQHAGVSAERRHCGLCGGAGVRPAFEGLTDYLYLYIGTFVGGGVVLNGSVYSGRTGNAGALGPLPVTGPDGKPVQLIDRASIMLLERMLRASGHRSVSALEQPRPLAAGSRHSPTTWVGIVARALAQAIVSAASIIDFEHVIIDGGTSGRCPGKAGGGDPRGSRRTTMSAASRCPPSCPEPWGNLARALGAASLPLVRQVPDRSQCPAWRLLT